MTLIPLYWEKSGDIIDIYTGSQKESFACLASHRNSVIIPEQHQGPGFYLGC